MDADAYRSQPLSHNPLILSHIKYTHPFVGLSYGELSAEVMLCLSLSVIIPLADTPHSSTEQQANKLVNETFSFPQ